MPGKDNVFIVNKQSWAATMISARMNDDFVRSLKTLDPTIHMNPKDTARIWKLIFVDNYPIAQVIKLIFFIKTIIRYFSFYRSEKDKRILIALRHFLKLNIKYKLH